MRAGRLSGRIGRSETVVSGAICPDVESWAAEHQGAESRELLAGRASVRTPPGTLEPTLLPAFTARMRHDHGRRYVVAVRDARIVGTSGLVVLPDGQAAVESVFDAPTLAGLPEFTHPQDLPVEHVRGAAVSLLVPWASVFNHYHWLHDSVLRLHDLIDTLPPRTSVVVPGWLRPVQVETLALVGVDRSRLVRCTGRTTLAPETLHFATEVSVSGYHRGEADRWLAERMRATLGLGEPGGDRRLYLSRRHRRRRVANEDAVLALLEPLGFEAVAPERLSLRDQVALFGQASVIVGPHGAALHNMIHAAPGAVVVDLVGPSLVDNAYIFWNQAQELGHDYWYLTTTALDADDPQADTVVPVDVLAATLAAAGIRSR